MGQANKNQAKTDKLNGTDMDIVIKNISMFSAERGRLMLCIPTEDGAHTYQQIDNPYLIALFHKAAKRGSVGMASFNMTISGADGNRSFG